MPVTNNNLRGIDRPVWEQLTSAPAASGAGSCTTDDGVRFIYYLIDASNFWCYDTWADTWQQLANPPDGTVAAATCLQYVTQMGTQLFSEVFGSVYALICSGAAVLFYRYDVATNSWGSALSVAGIPGAFGTDGHLICPEPALNAFEGGYHSAVALNTVTASAPATVNSTSILVSPLPLALPANAVLNFGTAAAPIWAVLTAGAAAGATSITVANLIANVPNAAVAYFYSDMFLWGNNSTAGYRYNFAANLWYTTSANAGNPTIAAAVAAPGAGMFACWTPGAYNPVTVPLLRGTNTIMLIRGGNSNAIYEYRFDTNIWSGLTYYPASETISTGSAAVVRSNTSGKVDRIMIQKDATGRFMELSRVNRRFTPKVTQNLVTSGSAVVGNRSSLVKSPDNIEFLYFIPSKSSFFLRTALFW